MSFCSYEEAWGAPYEPNTNYDPVTKNKDDQQVKELVVDNTHINEVNDGMAETAPLRGSMLGGVIPEQQWETNELKNTEPVSSFETRFDEKIDKLIKTIEKYTRSSSQPQQTEYNTTTWTDVLIFISLGVAAIFVLDMFFKFGKWIVKSQIASTTPPIEHIQPTQMPMNQAPPKYHYTPMLHYPFRSTNVPYYPPQNMTRH